MLCATLMLAFCAQATGQSDSTFIVQGQISHGKSGVPLAPVNIYDLTAQRGTISADDGQFSLEVSNWPAHIQFSYIGFETVSIRLEEPKDHWLDIQMQPYSTTLAEIVVSDRPLIATITKPSYTVRDYAFVDDKLLLLTLPGIAAGNALIYLDKEGQLIDSLSLKGLKRIDFLYKSCLDQIHLVSYTHDYLIGIDSLGIRIMEVNSRTSFDRKVAPCVAATDLWLIYQYRYCLGQLLRFQAFEKQGNQKPVFAEVANDENLERRYQEELAPFVGYIDQLNISWTEKRYELNRVLEGNMKLASLVHLFYQPIHIPLLDLGTHLGLFNHQSGQLEFYDSEVQKNSAVPINYHHEKKWDDQVLQDEKTGRVYTVFDHSDGKTIRQIKLYDGSLGPPVLIGCNLVEKMKIYDGWVYFLESGATTTAYNRLLKKAKLP